jgi:transcriptional regulator with XRE-family HTH domain
MKEKKEMLKKDKDEDLPTRELTDESVDNFLVLPLSCRQDSVDRIRLLFIHKVFMSAHPEPIHRIETKLSFGRWIESLRNSVRLSQKDVAAALGKNVTFLENIEKGEILPWNINPDDVSRLLRLVRLHINGLVALIANTINYQCLLPLEPHTSNIRRSDLTEGFSPLPKHIDPHRLNQDIDSWIAALRSDLEAHQANDLLD